MLSKEQSIIYDISYSLGSLFRHCVLLGHSDNPHSEAYDLCYELLHIIEACEKLGAEFPWEEHLDQYINRNKKPLSEERELS